MNQNEWYDILVYGIYSRNAEATKDIKGKYLNHLHIVLSGNTRGGVFLNIVHCVFPIITHGALRANSANLVAEHINTGKFS